MKNFTKIVDRLPIGCLIWACILSIFISNIFAPDRAENKAATNTPFAPAQKTIISTPTKARIPLCGELRLDKGNYITCKIPSAHCTYQPNVEGSPTFCNDMPYPNNRFTMIVWDSDWSFMDGSCLLISGTLSKYNGKLQIIVSSSSQVSFCPQ
ncbi:MAG: hypothetical protein HYZ25_19170 [Chloroflexi bacterium]|nr:hypothetical protein [Chloroflexota bacterium]